MKRVDPSLREQHKGTVRAFNKAGTTYVYVDGEIVREVSTATADLRPPRVPLLALPAPTTLNNTTVRGRKRSDARD